MCGGGFFLTPETLPTKHGPVLGGTKRKRRLLPAARTDGDGFLLIELIWRSLGGRGPFLLADLAPFGQIFKLLVVEETLFPGSEHKILAAIYTLQYLVLEFHGIPFQPQIRNIATARVWRDFLAFAGKTSTSARLMMLVCCDKQA
jgi:hypothetical protein